MKRLMGFLFISIMVIVLVGVVTAQIGFNNPNLPRVERVLGVDSFLDLSDTPPPSSYAGAGGDCVIVNPGETGLIFGNCSNATGGGSGDITAVNTDGPYLIGGAVTGDVDLLVNGTKFNETVEDLSLNKTGADLLYINLSGTNANQNINISPYNLTIGDSLTFRLGAVLDNVVNGFIRMFNSLNMMNNDITNVSTVFTQDVNVTREIFLNGYNLSLAVANSMGNGLIDGGIISIGTDPAKFDVTASKSWFVNNSNLSSPNLQYINCPAFDEITITNILVASRTDIALNRDCSLTQSTTPFSNVERRSKIVFGRIVHANRFNITVVVNLQHYALGVYDQYLDFTHAVGNINTAGNLYSAASTDLTITHTAGKIFRIGANYINTKDNPNEVSQSADAEVSFFYRWQDGAGGFNQSEDPTTDVDVGQYDDGSGTLASVPNNRFSIHRVYLFSDNATVLQYGQAIYLKLSEATAAISTEEFTADPNLELDAVLRGWIVVKGNTADLTDTSDAKIINAGKFGSLGGGTGTSAAQEVDLQNAYDNSDEPELVLTSSNLGLTIRDASSPLGVTLFEVQNNAGTVNFFNVSAEGAYVNDSQVCTADNGICANGSTFNATYDAKADYNFTNNNFNGSGNFNTTGRVMGANQTMFDALIANFNLWITNSVSDLVNYYLKSEVDSIVNGNASALRSDIDGNFTELDGRKVNITGDTMTGNLIVQHATAPTIAVIDTTNTVSTLMQSGNTRGLIGTSTDHMFEILTNSIVSAVVDTSQQWNFTNNITVNGLFKNATDSYTFQDFLRDTNGGWINDSIQTNNSLNANIQNGANISLSTNNSFLKFGDNEQCQTGWNGTCLLTVCNGNAVMCIGSIA